MFIQYHVVPKGLKKTGLKINARRHAIILLTFILSGFYVVAKNKNFKCPIKGGKIIERPNINGIMTLPGAEFYGKSKTVFNVYDGKVVSIDTTFFKDSSIFYLRVYVHSADYTFAFHGFSKLYVRKGQLIKAKDKIGELKDSEQLFLIMSYKGELVEPSKFLKCRIIRMPDL